MLAPGVTWLGFDTESTAGLLSPRNLTAGGDDYGVHPLGVSLGVSLDEFTLVIEPDVDAVHDYPIIISYAGRMPNMSNLLSMMLFALYPFACMGRGNSCVFSPTSSKLMPTYITYVTYGSMCIVLAENYTYHYGKLMLKYNNEMVIVLCAILEVSYPRHKDHHGPAT